MLQSIKRFAKSICFIGFLQVFLTAQDFRGNITGQVLDASGSAIPKATVKITNNSNNQTKESTTNDSGSYSLPYLDPGTYTLEVMADGFKKVKRTNVVVRVADKLNLPLSMQVGDMAQQVTVEAQSNEVDTADADRGLVFDPVKTQQYPLNGRQAYMLMALTPGVLFTQEQFGAQGFSGTRGWDANNNFKINGGRPGTSIFLLNGAPITTLDGSWEISPNVEAIQEFKVMTNVYDAQYGRIAGGVVNTTIKSGSNEWHGDVFDYFRNSVLDANTTQNNAIGQPRGFHNMHQFGGVAGGPVRKNKDFIFGSFEGWREVVPFPVVSDTVPDFLRTGQNFGNYRIYDPLTTRPCVQNGAPCPDSAFIRDPFPGNVIPTSRISPIGQRILSYYPSPNSVNPNALNQNFTAANNRGRYQYNQPMFRWDHVIGDKDKLYGLAAIWHGTEFRNSTGFAPPAGSGDINSARTNQNYIIDWTHVLSPTTVLDVRGSYTRYTTSFPRYTDTSLTADALGIGQIFSAPGSAQNTVPVITMGSYTQLFGLANSNSFEFSTFNQWDVAPSLTMTLGKHTIHAGFEWYYLARGAESTGANYGQLNFTQFWTQQLTGRNQSQFDGSSVASLLLGYPAGDGTYVDNNASFYRSRPYFAGYIQDNWKISNNFTLSWGLRYDVQVPWKERFNRMNNGFDFTTKNPLSDQIIANWNRVGAAYNAANPNDPYGGFPAAPQAIYGGVQFAGQNGRSQRAYPTDWTNVQPRIGIAWHIAPKTVIRTGGGVYYRTPTQENTTYGYQQRTPYVQSLNGLTPSASSLSGPNSLNQPFPTGVLPIPGASLGLATNIGNGINYDPFNYRVPRTYQYSFGFQQQLPFGMIADVAYTANQTQFESTGFQQNYITYDTFIRGQANPTLLDRQLPNPFFGILPANSSLGGGQQTSALNLLRPVPQFTGVSNNLAQWGSYRYDAFSLQLEKRLNSASKGNFTWVLSYTFSKAFEANHRLNDWNASEPLVHQLDNQDKPQSIAVSGVWDMPFGRGKQYANFRNPVVNGVLGNWTLSYIFTYYSGYPQAWPDLVLNSGQPGCESWYVQNPNATQWFNNNKSCYSTRRPYTFRTNQDRFPTLRNPAEPNANIALEKSFPINERFRFTLRGEAFNIANTVVRAGAVTDFNADNFGQLPRTQQNFPRAIQFAGKFYF